MNIKKTSHSMAEFNSLWKEGNEIYRNAAKKFGLSESVMWIVYFLRESGGSLTQRDICACMNQPKQTTNSALKQMERNGLITMTDGEDRRCRTVALTKMGNELAQRTVDKIIDAENYTMDQLSAQEQEQLMALFRKFNNILKKKIGELE